MNKTELNSDEVIKLYMSGEPVRKMAKILHVDVKRINRVLEDNGIEKRKDRIKACDVVSYYLDMHGIINTAQHFHIDRNRVVKILKEAGVQLRDIEEANKVGGKLKSKLARDKRNPEEICGLYNSGMSISEIGENLHVDYQNVRSVLVDSGVKLRSPKEDLDIKIQKAKNTCILKYGVDNPFKSSEAQLRFKKTCIDKYGVDNVLKSDEIRNKIKQTCLDRYGVENPWMSQEVLDKRTQTFISNYGVENPSQALEIKAKVSNTVQQKYGVPYACLLPQCSEAAMSNDSRPNMEFKKLLDRAGIEYSREFSIDNYRYDFKVGNNLIEINPSWTHSVSRAPFGLSPIDKNYHKDKTWVAETHGYRCIHVWDWDNKEGIINLLMPRERIYARNCTIDYQVSKDEARNFLNTYHIQGTARSSIIIGLRLDEKLVAVMTFGRPRINKRYEYELIRYATSKDIIGGAEKIWSSFIEKYNPKSVISYCDRSKFSGKQYIKLGFFTDGIVKPSRHWINNKHHFTDNLVWQRGFDQLLGKEFGEFGKGTSNEELLRRYGFLEVYDAGQQTFIWKKS